MQFHLHNAEPYLLLSSYCTDDLSRYQKQNRCNDCVNTCIFLSFRIAIIAITITIIIIIIVINIINIIIVIIFGKDNETPSENFG